MDDHRNDSRILGDINPEPDTLEPRPDSDQVRDRDSSDDDRGLDDSMNSMDDTKRDRTSHSGSRDVPGGPGGETGGTRNYRSSGGATGSDLGNRPE